jgi:hypothetical protein
LIVNLLESESDKMQIFGLLQRPEWLMRWAIHNERNIMNTTDHCNRLQVALKHTALALAATAGFAIGSAQARTTTTVIDLGVFPAYTQINSGTLYPRIAVDDLPVGSILRKVSWDVRLGHGDPYLGDLAVYFADRGGLGVLQVGAFGDFVDGGTLVAADAPIKLPWNAGGDYSYGAAASTTLTAADGVPAIDLHDHSISLETPYSGGWSGTITLEYEIGALSVALTSPAEAQAYPSGTSITATANVLEPLDDPVTDTVTFHTTPINPAGPTVETVSTDTSSPFSAGLGTLPAGSYEIYATVANNADPVGTATSATRTFTVAAPTPTTTVLAAAGPATTYGDNVAFTATVSPTPTGGTVQFYDGLAPLGSPVAVDPGTGEATYSTTTLGAGTREITAQYNGYQIYEPSPVSTSISQVVGQAQLTVKALNTLRAPNTANPDPFPYQISGYQNGENLATSGVTGTPLLTTDAILTSPAGDYVITCALGSLTAPNYSFTFVNGTLTVKVVADTFSVNFYAYPGWMTDEEQRANMRVTEGVPAGYDDWFTSGWLNVNVPFGMDEPQPPIALTSNKGSSATFLFKDCRNGWNYSGAPRTTLLGDGNGNMMDGHVNSTLDGDSNKFDMEITGIPFAVYDVIFYMGANLAQFGDGTGVIVFNGGAERAFTLKPGAFDGSFTEMVDATTQGNYIVFTGVTGSSFTTQTWGTGPNNFNHVGPFGFQVREAGVAPPTATLVIDLGTSPAGTTIEGGTFIGSGPTNLPLPTLPVGSILRSIAVNTKLEATDNENYASDLALLLDPTPGTPGGDFSVEITNGTLPLGGAALNLDWPASADGGVGTLLANTKTDATWAAAGPIDLATTGLFLGNAYQNESWVSPQGATWSGTITLTYDIVGAASKYEDWANGELFEDDTNGDGVKNGLAFLLGAADPDENALGRLPKPSFTPDPSGGLKLTFSVLKAADRGDAAALVQWSNDLGLADPWSANVAAVPPSTSVVNGVDFQVDSSGALDVIEATIPSTEALDGKLFGRLSGEEN